METLATWAVRLEGDVGLFLEARARYVCLSRALRAWRWRRRARALGAVAHEAACTDDAVAAALARAHRRAAREGCPAAALLDLLAEVHARRAELERLVNRRMGTRGAPLRAGLPALLEHLEVARRASPRAGRPSLLAHFEWPRREVASPRAGLPSLLAHLGRPRRALSAAARDAAAQDVLSRAPGLIPRLARFGAALEAVACRPPRRAHRLPFTREQLEALLAAWGDGEAALRSAWSAVEHADATGGLSRALAHRARRSLHHGLSPGPLALVHATFWRGAAVAQLDAVLGERFAPVLISGAERAAALRYLLARQADGAARFPAGGASARAALLMLAHELSPAQIDRPPLDGGRAQLRAWAAAADQLEGDDDWRRLRDATRVLPARALIEAVPLPPTRARWPARLLELFADAAPAW